MTQTNNDLCFTCAMLYREAEIYTIRNAGGNIVAKCAACGKKRPVYGVLVREKERTVHNA